MNPPLPSTGLPFSEGEARGGAILHEEPGLRVRTRRRNLLAFVILICGPLSFAALAPLAVGVSLVVWRQIRPDPGAVLAVLLMFAVGALVLAFTFWLARQGAAAFRRITPWRVYQFGVSMGSGETPFYPRASLYALEERKMRFGRDPYCTIIFAGGHAEHIAGVWAKNMHLLPDYKEVVQALVVMMGPFQRSPLWTDEAWERTNNLRGYRGPVRATLEALADAQSAPSIDLAFLEANWPEVQRRHTERRVMPVGFAALSSLPRDETPFPAVTRPAEGIRT